jgi:NAD(P)-dependent dehydrogenase (short-subunit alcohol dehydrogenase family)
MTNPNAKLTLCQFRRHDHIELVPAGNRDYRRSNKIEGGIAAMFDALRLDGKVAIITGGAGAIGSVTAEIMVGRGARVAIADIAMDRAEAVASKLGDAALAVELDLANEESIVACVKKVADHFGRIDILVNNAAAGGQDLVENDGLVGDMPNWVWDRTFAVNCRGAMIITRETLPHLLKTKGNIINTVSGLGLQGHVKQVAYGATKAAIVQLTRSIATGYGRASAVTPWRQA